MRKYKNLYDYFLSNRELNLDTLKSTIPVEEDYSDYLDTLEEIVGRCAGSIDEEMSKLIAEESIYLVPGDGPFIEYIEVP